ncbi:MAG: hypothetical protein ACI36Y_03100 [Coriobacteriales bacterium]
MGKFQTWLRGFMQGRYGFDELNHRLLTAVIVLLLASLVCTFLGRVANQGLLYGLGNIANMVCTLGIVYIFFRALSRNIPARRAENERFAKRQRRARNQKEFKYLKCPHCGQEMRVPRGKGKIAVKCPKCGESTITKS